MNTNRIAGFCAIFGAVIALASPLPAMAIGEQVGRIRGVVTNSETGELLEGVTVEATSPALIGVPRTTLTARNGRFELLDLPPGVYTINFSYPGTVASTRKVTLLQGQSISVNLDYALQAEEVESVKVTNRQLTKPDSSQTGAVRERASANRLPTGRSYQSLALQVPGTSGGANPNIKGGTSSMNKYLIDGLDTTDPVTTTFSANLTFDSQQSVEVITGGMDAEYNALGGIINVLTRGGSDQFHADVSFYANHQALSAKGTYGPNLYEGYQPLNSTVVGPTQSYQTSINVGGPIIPHKLWYGVTYELRFSQSSLAKSSPLGIPPFSIQHPPEKSLGHNARIRLDYAPTSAHRFWLSASTDPASFTNVDQTNAELGIAEDFQRQGGVKVLGGWEWNLNDHVTPGVQTGLSYQYLDFGPMGWFDKIDSAGCDQFSAANCTYDPMRPRHTNSADNTVWYQGDNVQIDRRLKFQFDPSVRIKAMLAGSHTIKTGVQAQVLRHTFNVSYPGNKVYTDNSPMPLEAGLCDPAKPGPNCYLRDDIDPYNVYENGYGLGFYVQDRWWTPLQWLTINPGLRLDWGRSTDYLGRQATNLVGLGPRLGFTADLTQDGRNILFGYYGRATDPVSLLVSDEVGSTEASVDKTYHWTAGAPNNGWGAKPVVTTGGPGGIKVSPDAKMPHTDEITFGFRRELFPNTVGSIEYTWKRIANTWNAIEMNRIWDPTGSRVVGYSDPKAQDRQVFLYATPDDPRRYRSLILSTEGQPTPHWDYSASYTLAYTTVTLTPDNPRFQQFYTGYDSSDIRHYFRLYLSYDVTSHLAVGGTFVYTTGVALTKSFYNVEDGNYSNRRSPLGTTPSAPNDAKTISEFRPPDQMVLNLRLSYDVIPLRYQHRLHLIVDIFNALNQATPTGISAADTTRFGQVAGRQTPRRIQLGLAYNY
jgi:hypothetical protein